MSNKCRSINTLRADEIFGAVTEVLQADVAGLPFPFSGRRALTEREATLAAATAAKAVAAKAKANAKAKAKSVAAEATTDATRDPPGTPEFGREEAKRGASHNL
jgi:hypothetical protein